MGFLLPKTPNDNRGVPPNRMSVESPIPVKLPEPLDLKPEWELAPFQCGGVHIERLIGGCRVSVFREDGTAISEEFTPEEFHAMIKRAMGVGLAWKTIVSMTIALWLVLGLIVAGVS